MIILPPRYTVNHSGRSGIEWQAQSREWLPLSWEYRTLSRGRSSGYLLGALCEFEKSLGGIKYFNSFKGSISEV